MKPSNFNLKLQRFALSGLLLGVGPIHNAVADTWVPYAQTWVGLNGTHMGASIATDGDQTGVKFIYVGAPNETVGAFAGAGKVYVWAPSPQGVMPVATLTATLPQAGAHFGASLAARNGSIVVGAPDYNDSSGAGAGAGYVQFFFNNGSDPIVSRGGRIGAGGNFGSAVAVNVDFAVISAVQAGNGDGCIYTFHYNLPMDQWIPFPSNDVACGSAGEELGASVAILETSSTNFFMVAGAPAATQSSNALAGAAHVFFPNNGSLLEIGTLTAQNPAFLDLFGASVGIDANYVYVGGSGRDNGAARTGSVTIFKPASIIGYNYLAEYFPGPPATDGGHCGASLNVDPVKSGFVLGCPGSNTVFFNGEGTARVYREFSFLGNPVWIESLLSYGVQPHGADALGTSVDIHGDYAFAGAPNRSQAPGTGNGAFKEFAPDQIFRDGFEG
jgi:hypothetical protein